MTLHVRPAFGECPFGFSHTFKNPHSSPACLRVTPLGVESFGGRGAARDAREFLTVEVKKPVFGVMRDAIGEVDGGFSVFMQPMAEVCIHMSAPNSPLALSFDHYTANFQVRPSKLQIPEPKS